MSDRCHHILLTKFNVVLEPGLGRHRGLDPDWLRSRTDLFFTWTVPSVLSQSHPPAAWLIFVDGRTPIEVVSLIESRTAPIGRVCPVEGLLTDEYAGRLVASHIPDDTAVLLSSRIDNDDAIAADYLARIHAAAVGWQGFVNVASGLRIADGAVFRCWDHRGPFLTMIEEVTSGRPPMTAFCVEHYRASTVAPVRQVRGRPGWTQVIHGQNIANEASGLPFTRQLAERAMGWTIPGSASTPRVRESLIPACRAASDDLRSRLATVRRRRAVRGESVDP